MQLAIIAVIVVLLVLYLCMSEGMASHVRTSATSRPIPRITPAELDEIRAKIVKHFGLKDIREIQTSTNPALKELTSAFYDYSTARGRLSDAKTNLLRIESRLTDLGIASQNNYTQEVKDQTRDYQAKWQDQQKTVANQITIYNVAGRRLRAVQKSVQLELIRF